MMISAKNNKEKRNLLFIKSSWGIIESSQKILKIRTQNALDNEIAANILMKELLDEKTELSSEEKKRILKNLAALKLEDAGKLSTIISSMFDKASLAMGSPTVNVKSDIETSLKKFEDL